MRLALLYALLDESDHIKVEHLKAAEAVWQCAEASAEYIFGTATGNHVADRIKDAIKDSGSGGLTQTEINRLFNSHKNKEAALALAELRDEGFIVSEEVRTSGRPKTTWRLANGT